MKIRLKVPFLISVFERKMRCIHQETETYRKMYAIIYFWWIFVISERKIMRKLALSDEILLSVDKAARYIGGEVNSIMKDKDKVNTRIAFCFPDV